MRIILAAMRYRNAENDSLYDLDGLDLPIVLAWLGGPSQVARDLKRAVGAVLKWNYVMAVTDLDVWLDFIVHCRKVADEIQDETPEGAALLRRVDLQTLLLQVYNHRTRKRIARKLAARPRGATRQDRASCPPTPRPRRKAGTRKTSAVARP